MNNSKAHKNIESQLPALFEKLGVPVDRRDVKILGNEEIVDVYALTDDGTINMNFCGQTGNYLFTERWNKIRFSWDFLDV